MEEAVVEMIRGETKWWSHGEVLRWQELRGELTELLVGGDNEPPAAEGDDSKNEASSKDFQKVYISMVLLRKWAKDILYKLVKNAK